MSYGSAYTWDREGKRFWIWKEGGSRERGRWANDVEKDLLIALSQSAFDHGRATVQLEQKTDYAEARLALLRRVDQFLTNGIALGYIRMPDADCPDPAKELPGLVKAAIKTEDASCPGSSETGEAARAAEPLPVHAHDSKAALEHRAPASKPEDAGVGSGPVQSAPSIDRHAALDRLAEIDRDLGLDEGAGEMRSLAVGLLETPITDAAQREYEDAFALHGRDIKTVWLRMRTLERSLSQVPKQDWLDPKDSRPVAYTTVLLVTDIGERSTGFRTTDGRWMWDMDGESACPERGAPYRWMPLSEPPPNPVLAQGRVIGEPKA